MTACARPHPAPRLGVSSLTLLVTLWVLLSMNMGYWLTLWHAVGGQSNPSPTFLASLPVVTASWLFLILSLLTWGRASKPVLALLLLVSAAASYFMDRYGVLIDSSMLTNVLQTDPAEAGELISPRLLLWMTAVGILPAILLYRVQLARRGWKRELLYKLAGILAGLACLLGTAFSFYQPYASLLRNNHELRLLLVPANVLGAGEKLVSAQFRRPAALQRVGTDAQRPASAGTSRRHRVMVVAVGETARAANFGLDGYARNTTPQLARLPVINFPHASSCGTSTAVSVPCMFMDVGRRDYRDSMAGNREGLMDILQRAGVAVLWRENNSGCKGACDRVPTQLIRDSGIPEICSGFRCQDEALLAGLQDYLDGLDRDAVIVLHMKGSHGPAYYLRYPPAFEQFTPVCRSNELEQCSRESIVNAYDNTLLYTDHVLAGTIGLLQKNSQLDTALLYMSDHGESLGENGVYLHGLPYAMAPQEQTHIPMVLWLSDPLQQSSGITASCMQQQARAPVSHDNLFHSVLGMMNVQTSVYRAQDDLFLPCQSRVTGSN